MSKKIIKRPLVPLFLSLTTGIYVSYFLKKAFNQIYLLLSAILIIILLFSNLRYKNLIMCILFFILGILFGEKELTKKSELLAYTNRDIVLEGIILEPPSLKSDKKIAVLRCRIKRIFIKDTHFLTDEDIMLIIYRYNLMLEPGDRIRFLCRLKEIKNFRNPGVFNYRAFMKRKRIVCKAYVKDGRYVVFMGKAKLPVLYRITESLKAPIRDFFKKELEYKDFGIFSAIVLGERGNLDKDTKEIINKAGLGHILAVSGLHIGLVAYLSFIFIRWLILRSYRLTLLLDPKKTSAVITFIPVTLYCLISGFRIPTQRAMIMIFVYLISIILERQDDIVSSLCFAGMIILSMFPFSIFSASFQLSFIAVAGIIWLMPYIKEYTFPYAKNRLLSYLLDLIAVTISSLIVLLPFILYYFHRLPILSILANISTIPILGLWIIPTSLFSVFILPVSYKIAAILLNISDFGMHIMLSLIKTWATIPCSSIWLFRPYGFEIVLYYGLLFFIIKKRHKIAKAGIMIICIIFLLDAIYWINRTKFNENLRITFLDAGKEFWTLVEFPRGKKMLIHKGNFEMAKMAIAPFLWYSRILKIDYILPLDHKKLYTPNFISKVFGAKQFEKLNSCINGVMIKRWGKKAVAIKYKNTCIVFMENAIEYPGKCKNVIFVFLSSLKKKFFENVKNKGKTCMIISTKIKNTDFFYKIYNPHKDGAIQVEITDKIKIRRLYHEGM